MRTQALAKREVGDFLSQHFVATFDRVGTFQVDVGEDGKRPNRNGGNVAAFFCSPNGYVIHAVAGPRTAEAFLAEAKWATEVYSQIVGSKQVGNVVASRSQYNRVASALKQAHATALELITNPNPFAEKVELVHHEPSSNPSLRNLEQKGLAQRKQVHQMLKGHAYEPLAQLGPKVYSEVLGERVTGEPVQVRNTGEFKQVARPGKGLLEFYESSAGLK